MSNSSKICVAVLIGIGLIAVLVIALVATSLKKLASNEVGIAYDKFQKKLSDTVKNEGLHNGPPGFEFIIFPNVYTTMNFRSLSCLNKDGVTITLDVAYQYKARVTHIKDIILKFKDFDGYKDILKYTGSAALHEACSLFNTSQVQAERGAFQEMVRQKLRERYDVLKCDITDLQVNNIERPREYESSIRSKERAREDIQVAVNERPRLLTEAKTERREAETQAQIILDKARSEARILENQARAEAEAIQTQYEKEGEAYESILSSNGLGFTTEGFISYMGVRVISSAKNPVFIGLQSPAKSSYMTP
ncbi:uncharacterized protein LOC124113655 [Haliotis rufescens]|uniref:uncharacterized protein LOC124113655 n=1 Tax=Haliotis rufescens TaxID=6454 RepID=UPI001EB05B56|nr:uncharacterized protein LOC124113655 [Haliotis rufescens]XP_046330079.1 uncharacterized protein LOC124113655 [Haliotis rufescens]